MEFKVGQLYANSDPMGRGWCKHGRATIESGGERDPSLYAVDTYWGPNQNGYRRNIEEIKDKLTFIIDMTECRYSHRDEYDVYADVDRAYIPIGGGGEKFLIRRAALPDPTRYCEWLRAKIEGAKRESEYALRSAAWYQQTLDQFEAKESK